MTSTAAGRFRSLRDFLRYYYEGHSPEAKRFRYAMVAFDLATIVFIVATSFVPGSAFVEWVNLQIGLVILGGFIAQLIVSHNLVRHLLHPSTWVEVIVILSFLAPAVGAPGGFLRILRTLRLLHTYQVLGSMREDSALFRRHEEVFVSIIHLTVFLFIMTAIVYETQHWSNPDISNYIDALYFTVTTLTTTGFGDITLPGTTGRLISVAIMIFGVTIFLRLAPRAALAAQGPLPLPHLRAAAARRRRRPLQGLRRTPQHSRRGVLRRGPAQFRPLRCNLSGGALALLPEALRTLCACPRAWGKHRCR